MANPIEIHQDAAQAASLYDEHRLRSDVMYHPDFRNEPYKQLIAMLQRDFSDEQIEIVINLMSESYRAGQAC